MSCSPAGPGILQGGGLLPAVPGGEAGAMRPSPTRWQWDSLSPAAALGAAGVCTMRYRAPEGVPGASRVCRVCVVWWDTLYLHTLLSNKEFLDQISESQREFGCGSLVRAALLAVGARDPSLDFWVVTRA